MLASELEPLIVDEVRRHRHCDGFQSITFNGTDQHVGTNWIPANINYGNASPKLCDEALRGIIPRMQRKYDLRT
jgi:hypothetical protein